MEVVDKGGGAPPASLGEVLIESSRGILCFQAFRPGTTFPAGGGVFAVTRRDVAHHPDFMQHLVLYVGEADSIERGIQASPAWSYLPLYGANCICIYREDCSAMRLRMLDAVLAVHRSPCNALVG